MNRFCKTCRTPLVRKVRPSGLESAAAFARRKFCDHVCKVISHKPKQARSHPWNVAGDAMAQKLRDRGIG